MLQENILKEAELKIVRGHRTLATTRQVRQMVGVWGIQGFHCGQPAPNGQIEYHTPWLASHGWPWLIKCDRWWVSGESRGFHCGQLAPRKNTMPHYSVWLAVYGMLWLTKCDRWFNFFKSGVFDRWGLLNTSEFCRLLFLYIWQLCKS